MVRDSGYHRPIPELQVVILTVRDIARGPSSDSCYQGLSETLVVTFSIIDIASDPRRGQLRQLLL